jgi:transcriptional regulator with XRE-family HTH domain
MRSAYNYVGEKMVRYNKTVAINRARWLPDMFVATSAASARHTRVDQSIQHPRTRRLTCEAASVPTDNRPSMHTLAHASGKRRTNLGLSQEQRGNAIGLTFQQVQKYERGTARVSASKLHDLSQTLDVTVSFFFDGLPAASTEKAASMSAADDEQLVAQETLDLVRVTTPFRTQSATPSAKS